MSLYLSGVSNRQAETLRHCDRDVLKTRCDIVLLVGLSGALTVDSELIAGDSTAEELGLKDNAIIDTAFVHSGAGVPG